VSAADRSLRGRVVVTTDPGVARAVARDGATVVIVGPDAAALGVLAGEIAALGGRAAIVVGTLDDDDMSESDADRAARPTRATRAALAELLDELFPPP